VVIFDAQILIIVDTNQSVRNKNEEVEVMFNDIAHRYDFLNHFLSMGTDRLWRRRTINAIGRLIQPSSVLDVATGTGDLAIASLRLKPERVTGIDLSEGMLEIGRKKIMHRHLEKQIVLQRGNSESIPFSNGQFDVVMCAFGVRNFGDPLRGLSEMLRVLRPGGVVAVLEFSKPSLFPVKQLYFFYFRRILPLIGKILSGDPSAYTYLPDSVMSFPDGDEFLKLMAEAGFGMRKLRRLSGGIATIYTGIRTE